MRTENSSATAETIVLVEDETFVREVTQEILRSAGYRVWPAKNAEAAEAIFDEHGWEIDVLVTDIILPGETGRVLGARMQQRNPCLKTLYISGYPEQIHELEISGEECLAKPFTSDVLLRKVRGGLHETLRVGEDSMLELCAGA
jgi:DNA-binding NtrC family response regulator